MSSSRSCCNWNRWVTHRIKCPLGKQTLKVNPVLLPTSLWLPAFCLVLIHFAVRSFSLWLGTKEDFLHINTEKLKRLQTYHFSVLFSVSHLFEDLLIKPLIMDKQDITLFALLSYNWLMTYTFMTHGLFITSRQNAGGVSLPVLPPIWIYLVFSFSKTDDFGVLLLKWENRFVRLG